MFDLVDEENDGKHSSDHFCCKNESKHRSSLKRIQTLNGEEMRQDDVQRNVGCALDLQIDRKKGSLWLANEVERLSIGVRASQCRNLCRFGVCVKELIFSKFELVSNRSRPTSSHRGLDPFTTFRCLVPTSMCVCVYVFCMCRCVVPGCCVGVYRTMGSICLHRAQLSLRLDRTD